jgi:predicted NUDIX family NTP pyrophosphohydrolase
MPKRSAGILLYRLRPHLEVLLVHPGGPYWARKNLASWTIPKGEIQDGEQPFDAALREFAEETGFPVSPPFLELTPVKQPGGKLILAWAAPGDADPAQLRSLTFTLEWPPRSGRQQEFPEIDRAAWFPLDEALLHILPGQAPFLHQLAASLPSSPPASNTHRN